MLRPTVALLTLSFSMSCQCSSSDRYLQDRAGAERLARLAEREASQRASELQWAQQRAQTQAMAASTPIEKANAQLAVDHARRDIQDFNCKR